MAGYFGIRMPFALLPRLSAADSVADAHTCQKYDAVPAIQSLVTILAQCIDCLNAAAAAKLASCCSDGRCLGLHCCSAH